MNKKGFTLVELLATIIILGLLTLLASTSVTKVLKESKGDLYTAQIKLVESAAKTWGAENIDKLPTNNECKYLTIKTLQDYGLIDKDISNPKTGEKIDNNIKIKISSSKTGYGNEVINYEIDPDTVDGCSHVMLCQLVSGETNTVGAKYLCDLGSESRYFYVLEEGKGSKPTTLILDDNYDTTYLPWCKSGENISCNADGIEVKLDEIADVWTNLNRSQIGIPSIEQILVADGQEYDESVYWISSQWLYNSTSNAYWTSTTLGSYVYGVWADALVETTLASVNGILGVRPVINIKL